MISKYTTCATLRAIITAVFSLLCCCTNFSSQYERIENNRIRLIDFIYEPPEAAPGDTVLLRALFAGKNITQDDIDWNASFKVVLNAYGTDTAFEEQPLTVLSEACSTFHNTTCISMRFIIPRDCILESPMVSQDWLSLLPDTLKKIVPSALSSFTKQQIVGMIDSIAALLPASTPSQRTEIVSQLPDELVDVLPLVMQVLTVKIRLFAYVKNSHRIRSDYSVSYAPRFAQLPECGVYVNHNPVIDSIGLYKVKGADIIKLDRDGENTEYTRLYPRDDSDIVIESEKGYTYFLEVFVSGRDSALTLYDIAFQQPASLEDLSADWMFQMDEEETDGLIANDLMNISPINDCTAFLFMPRKESVRKFTIWVQVTDSRINVLNRSQGSMVAQIHGSFSYP